MVQKLIFIIAIFMMAYFFVGCGDDITKIRKDAVIVSFCYITEDKEIVCDDDTEILPEEDDDGEIHCRAHRPEHPNGGPPGLDR